MDQLFNAGGQVAWILAQRHPEDAVVKGVLNPFVVTNRTGQRRFAVSAGSAQRGGDCHWSFAALIEQQRDELIELIRAWDEATQIFDHKRHAPHIERLDQVVEKLPPFGTGLCTCERAELITMLIAHPARPALQIQMWRAFDGINADPLLVSIAPLFADDI